MAYVHEEIIMIKLSKLIKENPPTHKHCDIDAALAQQIEALVQELVGDTPYIVEVKHDHEAPKGKSKE